MGPLVTPRRIVDAVIAGDADAGPLDSYAHLLLRNTEPALAARIRAIATTAPTSIPPLVASSAVAPADVTRLTEALLAVHESAHSRLHAPRSRSRASLACPPRATTQLVQRADIADAQGYRELA